MPFAAAVAVGALAGETAAMATLVAAVSMAATPAMFAVSGALPDPLPWRGTCPGYETIPPETPLSSSAALAAWARSPPACRACSASPSPRWHRIPDRSMSSAASATRAVSAPRPDLLRSASAEQAKLLIVVLDDMEAVLRTVEVAKRNFPNLKILARARNRRHAHLLMDRNVDGLVRDTFHSSLRLAEDSLVALGISADDAAHSVELFRDHDERNLVDAHAIYRDEKQLIQSAQQAAEELTSLFEADRRGEER